MADKPKKKSNVFYLVCIAVMIISIAYVIWYFAGHSKRISAEENNSETLQYAAENSGTYQNVTYNGKSYTYNRNLKTMLFMGIDQHDEAGSYSYKGTGGRSDCMILFIMNEADGTAKMLEISRDTMTKIAVYDTKGEYALDSTMQLTMQYSFGDGANKSCRLTKEAISNLLHNIPIDEYFSMNIDGIKVLNDAIGGVTLTVPQDYTEIDPEFKEGETITLDGEQAEKYVRKRDTSVTGSKGRKQPSALLSSCRMNIPGRAVCP